MRPEQIDRVFGRGRLKMATGEHVEVFREAVALGERRRYTKRFLNTREGDFGQWTEREWRILARLIGHGIACVPDVVQFDRGRLDGMQLVQTYDAGVTVDQWATLLPVERDGRLYRHVFEDCAHWWALAHHCLLALNVIHPLELVHLDVKGDNVCIPYAPSGFDPDSPDLHLQPIFAQLALIDFAFALISRERLTTPLPIGWQKDYDYQSPRLLAALEAGRNGELQLTRELDWRCDMYSLAAMLKRYLPGENHALQPHLAAGWSAERYDAAKALILRIRESHDRELPAERPHAALIALCAEQLCEDDLARSLQLGWTLAREATVSPASASPLTPVTRVAPAVPVTRSGRTTAVTVVTTRDEAGAGQPRLGRPRVRLPLALAALIALGTAGAVLWNANDRAHPLSSRVQALAEPIRLAANRATDAMRRLVDREPGAAAQGGVAGHATGPPSAAAPPLADEGPPAPSASVKPTLAAPGPRVAAESGSAGAVPAAASAPMQALHEVETPRPAPRPPMHAATSSGSTAIAATRQTATTGRVQSPSSHGQTMKTPTLTHIAPSPSSTPSRRLHASWASLQPPSWLHGTGPGEPPGAKTRQRNPAAPATSSSTGVSSGTVAAMNSAGTERALTVAPAADPAPAPAPSTAPAAAGATSNGATAFSAPAPAASAAAPIEDRSSTVVLALAPAAAAPEPHLPSVAERMAAIDFADQARRTLLDPVPRLATQIEPGVARVLWLAANAYHPIQERNVADAARLVAMPDDTALRTRALAPGEARRFNDQARVFAARRNIQEAFNSQLRAFGANPRDPDVAGNLAQLYLKLSPPQPELARQVGLVAIAVRGSLFHSARIEDWRTFAVASALGGREVDATNALFVTLALAGDAERGCTAALTALAGYGERLRRPVEAVFYRVQAQGRGYDSPACAWPPNWAAVSRLP